MQMMMVYQKDYDIVGDDYEDDDDDDDDQAQ